jgi:glycine cleavage system H lipoate-binding protein
MVMQKTELTNKRHCIWMEAGVIDYKICDNLFDCNTCKFDRAMARTAEDNIALRQAGKEPMGKKRNIIHWQDKMRQRSGLEQKCRHMITGRVPAYYCGNNYNCHRCTFDQMLEEQFEVFTNTFQAQTQDAFGFRVPTNAFLHRGHSWAVLENAGRVRIGLDDFSQKLLGRADETQLPNVGEKVKQDLKGLALARQGKKAGVLSPLDGIVEAVNPEIRRHPELIHDDPYGEGWVAVISPTNLKPNLEKLLYGESNAAWIDAESHRLLGFMESSLGVTLPTGGAIIDDVYGHYPQLGWEHLVQEFLLTD